MKQELIDFINSKSPNAKPLYLVIRGSHAYGTSVPTSDIDYSGVFIQSHDDILGNKYIEQINDDKNDTVIYEVRRFLELLQKNNPTVLELLNTPEDCILYKDPIFDEILSNRDKFITKICANSFGGYAKAQIQKAKGQNKKQNWEKEKITRKTPLDFCYLIQGSKTTPISEWLERSEKDQSKCGLVKIPHSRDIYALYYDFSDLYEPEYFTEMGIPKMKFKGISFEDSNDIRLSSVPDFGSEEKEWLIGQVSYNKDGYTQHCNDYKSYETWINERNMSRWVDVSSHGQKIDGKNMMHCKRLMQMAREIAEGKGIIVKRPNAQELISIRKGEVDLQTLINDVESEIVVIDNLFKSSNLPESVDEDFINTLLVSIRKKIYNV